MWVARDKNEELCFWNIKPIRNNVTYRWVQKDYIQHWIKIDKKLFPNLKWEDEPIEVELVVKGKVEELIDYICKQDQEIRELKNEIQKLS